jgi:metal-responsive CopG/Arc/MetJ family transcriptional regulator
MPTELLEEIDRLARTEFVSRSDVIRTFVRQQLAERERSAA